MLVKRKKQYVHLFDKYFHHIIVKVIKQIGEEMEVKTSLTIEMNYN
jgi:hypothetical protein